jgi:phage terminase small subunit
MAMNPKRERFAAEYLIDLNATQAAIRAGYSERSADVTGSRLLGDASISALIAEKRAERSERTNITQDYVLESIFSAIKRCKQAEAVTDRNGNPIMVETPDGDLAPAYTFNAAGVFKGAEMLGKHLGMFQGETASNVGPITVVFERD